jgi:hypothetical protein
MDLRLNGMAVFKALANNSAVLRLAMLDEAAQG